MALNGGVNKREVGEAAGAAAGAGIAAYIRVSSSSQDYEHQRTAIDAAARARGAPVAVWYADVQSAGTLERAELQRLLRALEARCGITHVWVWSLDRLSRGGIGETFEVVTAIRRAGAVPLSVTEGFAFELGPIGDIMLAMLAWGAQQERLRLRERQAAARERMALQGRPWGRPRLAAHIEDAIPVLKSQGKSTREIARELEISRSVVGKRLRAKTR